MFKLNRLENEWGGRRSPVLYALLMFVRTTESYDQTLRRCRYERNRTARNPLFVARLLRLTDERTMPLMMIQGHIGMQLGHLFRTFERAGVNFQAVTVHV